MLQVCAAALLCEFQQPHWHGEQAREAPLLQPQFVLYSARRFSDFFGLTTEYTDVDVRLYIRPVSRPLARNSMIIDAYRLALFGKNSNATPGSLGPSKSAVLHPVPTRNFGDQLDRDRPFWVETRLSQSAPRGQKQTSGPAIGKVNSDPCYPHPAKSNHSPNLHSTTNTVGGRVMQIMDAGHVESDVRIGFWPAGTRPVHFAVLPRLIFSAMNNSTR